MCRSVINRLCLSLPCIVPCSSLWSLGLIVLPGIPASTSSKSLSFPLSTAAYKIVFGRAIQADRLSCMSLLTYGGMHG